MKHRLFTLRWLIRHRWQRLRRAVAYAAGCLSQDDAQSMILDCRRPAGWYPLMVLSPDDVRDMAADLYGDATELDPYLHSACEYVARKWDEPGDDYWHARQWALDLALQDAAADGIPLTVPSTATHSSEEDSSGGPHVKTCEERYEAVEKEITDPDRLHISRALAFIECIASLTLFLETDKAREEIDAGADPEAVQTDIDWLCAQDETIEGLIRQARALLGSRRRTNQPRGRGLRKAR